MDSQTAIPYPSAGLDYARTRWSMVAAVREGNEATARRSLSELCRRYWVPVYAYIRRSGYSPEDAPALTQRFLSHTVTQLRADQVDAAAGFRAYLETQLESFLASISDEQSAVEILEEMRPPWPLDQIEARQQQEHPTSTTPTQALQRAFALEMLAIALEQLRQEAVESGRSELFDKVRPFLSREPTPEDYEAIAVGMKSSPLAAVIAVKRLRQRFQELIDEELAQTIGVGQVLETERHTLLTLVMPDAED